MRETAVLQPLLEQFPTQINRENILGNRESFSGNREFLLQTSSGEASGYAQATDPIGCVATDTWENTASSRGFGILALHRAMLAQNKAGETQGSVTRERGNAGMAPGKTAWGSSATHPA